MAALNIKNLPNELHYALRKRAEESGRSIELEALTILFAALEQPATDAKPQYDNLQKWVALQYRGKLPNNVVENLIEQRRNDAQMENKIKTST